MKKRGICLVLVLAMVMGMAWSLTACKEEQPDVVDTLAAWLAMTLKTSVGNDVTLMGDVMIQLYESQEELTDPTHDSLVQAHENHLSTMKLIPGIVLGKYSYIENTGTTPAYVRFRVVMPKNHASIFELDFNTQDFDVAQEGNVYYVTGKQPLAGGAIAGPGLKTLEVRSDVSPSDIVSEDSEIVIYAEAIESTRFQTAAEAFAAFDERE